MPQRSPSYSNINKHSHLDSSSNARDVDAVEGVDPPLKKRKVTDRLESHQSIPTTQGALPRVGSVSPINVASPLGDDDGDSHVLPPHMAVLQCLSLPYVLGGCMTGACACALHVQIYI